MEITEAISAAISDHEEAVNAVSEALGLYRRDSADPATDEDPERQLNQAGGRYERSSVLLTGLILEQLVVFSNGEENSWAPPQKSWQPAALEPSSVR